MPFDARVRILLVEDDPEDHLIVSSLLHDIDGWEPELDWASSYEEGLSSVQDVHYDVALVDYQLGARTGIDFIGEERLRATGTPAIILTGQGGRAVDLDAARAGAVDYLRKRELTSEVLERSIRFAVEARRRHEVEAHFRALIENGRDLITVLKPDGTARYVSPSLVRVLGFEPEEMVGSRLMEEVHPDDRSQVDEGFQRLLDEPDTPQKIRYRVRHRDGTWRVLDTVAQNLLADPLIRGIVLNSWDVTDLHDTEAALRRERADLQKRVKELRCLYRVQRALQGAEGSWEAALQEVVDAIPPGFHFPERMGARLRLEGRSFQTAGFRESDWCLGTRVTSGGASLGRLDVCFLRAPPQEPEEAFLPEERPLVDAIADRVGEAWARRRAEEELGASEAFHRALIERSGLVVAVADRQAKVRHVGGEVESLLGRSPEELLDRDLAEVLAPHDAPGMRRLVDEAVDDPGVTVEGIVALRDARGDQHYVEYAVRSLLDDDVVGGIVVTGRDVTERVLRERQVRFQAELLEQVGQPVFATDTEGRITYWNRAAERVLGWSWEEMEGESFLERVVPPELRERAVRIQAGVNAGEPWEGEIPLIRKDGERVIVHGTVTATHNADGTPAGRIATGADITELRRTEAELREQKELLAGVASNAPVILFAIDAGGRIRFSDGRGLAQIGLEPRELVGRNAFEVYEDHPELQADVGRALTGESFRTVHDAYGRVLETWWSPLGSTGGTVGVSLDVTERERAAQRIRFQAELLDAVGQAVISTDLEGTVTYWNSGAEELYGWTREEAVGRNVLEVTPAEGAREEAAEVLEQLRRGETWTGEMELRRKDGSTFPALVTDAPLHDSEGRLVGIVGVSQDLTDRKTLEEELRQAQKMEAIGRLAGGVAHDFNNLLTAIQGHAGLLLEDLDVGSALHEEVSHIRTAGERAADLTRQLLAFSRKQMLQDQVLDLGRSVRDMEPMLRRLIPASVELRFRSPDEPMLVKADPGQVQQVVMNLAVNAGDAMDGEGVLSVEVDATRLRPAQADAISWAARPGPYVRLTVSDTGTGIDPEVLPHIFEPFYTTKGEGKGTGLGLSTVFGIVKQSGGHIFVDGDEGSGATFRILLPRVQGVVPEAQEAELPVPERSRERRQTVLLVEDDASVRRLARRVLERAGYGVVEARNGREALEIAGEPGPELHLVVSDVVMPEMGGTRLTDLLHERHPDLRVVLTSGYSEEELRGRVRDRGAAFLGKPFTPDDLVAVVRRTLANETVEES